MDAVLKHRNIEIDEQPDPPSTDTQVGQQLSIMNWGQGFDGFAFDYYGSRDQQIHPIATAQMNTLVFDWQRLLLFKRN